MKIIDPHLHLFDKSLGEYAWLAPHNAPFWPDKALINKNFSIDDISLTAPFEHCGFVHIEAGFDNSQPWREIKWLQTLDTNLMKSIACVDLTLPSTEFNVILNDLCQYSSLCGVRHILDENAYSLLKNPQVQHNLSQIAAHDLIFECQLNGSDSAAMTLLTSMATSNPGLKIVINHAAFPAPQKAEYLDWQSNMRDLAQCNNIYVKASGWEMLDRAYQQQQIQQIVTWLLSIFGNEKIILASNFPLCLFSCSYQWVWQSYSQLDFNPATLNALVYENAKNLYRF